MNKSKYHVHRKNGYLVCEMENKIEALCPQREQMPEQTGRKRISEKRRRILHYITRKYRNSAGLVI